MNEFKIGDEVQSVKLGSLAGVVLKVVQEAVYYKHADGKTYRSMASELRLAEADEACDSMEKMVSPTPLKPGVYKKNKPERSKTVNELSADTLDSYAEKARKDAKKTADKAGRTKGMQKALELYRSAADRSASASKAEQKSRTSRVLDSWK